jgi:predicted nucleic acid-binding protein
MLLDTFAWVEYFRSTSKGKKVKKLIVEEQCFTCAISLAELSYWASKEKVDLNKILFAVKSLSIIINLDNTVLETAGMLNYQKKKKIKNFGMIDAIILATSRAYSLPVVSGDKHFSEEEGTIIL